MNIDQLIELLPAFLAGLVPSILAAVPALVSLMKNIKIKKVQEKIDATIQSFEFGLTTIVHKLETVETKYKEKTEFTISEAMNVLNEMKEVATQSINDIRIDLGHRLDVIESEMNKHVDEVHE